MWKHWTAFKPIVPGTSCHSDLRVCRESLVTHHGFKASLPCSIITVVQQFQFWSLPSGGTFHYFRGWIYLQNNLQLLFLIIAFQWCRPALTGLVSLTFCRCIQLIKSRSLWIDKTIVIIAYWSKSTRSLPDKEERELISVAMQTFVWSGLSIVTPVSQKSIHNI